LLFNPALKGRATQGRATQERVLKQMNLFKNNPKVYTLTKFVSNSSVE